MTAAPDPGIAALAAALTRLSATIEARRDAAPSASYVASLLQGDIAKAAKKLGEEGLEAALAGALKDHDGLVKESADVLFHLLVLWAASRVGAAEVAAELERREGVSGIAEKAARNRG